MVEHFRGGSINISCSFTGIPVPTITWFKNNSELQFSEIIRLAETSQSNATWGRRQSTVIFGSLQLTDTADYHCVANNNGAPGNTFVVQSNSSSIFVTSELNKIVPLNQQYHFFSSLFFRSSTSLVSCPNFPSGQSN